MTVTLLVNKSQTFQPPKNLKPPPPLQLTGIYLFKKTLPCLLFLPSKPLPRCYFFPPVARPVCRPSLPASARRHITFPKFCFFVLLLFVCLFVCRVAVTRRRRWRRRRGEMIRLAQTQLSALQKQHSGESLSFKHTKKGSRVGEKKKKNKIPSPC